MGLREASPAGFQSYMLWGPISWVQVLKVGAPAVGSEPFDPQGGTGSPEFPLGRVIVPGGVYGEIASQPLLPIPVWVFSHSPDV